MRILAYAMDYWSDGQIKAIFFEHEVGEDEICLVDIRFWICFRVISVLWAVYESLSGMKMICQIRLPKNDSHFLPALILSFNPLFSSSCLCRCDIDERFLPDTHVSWIWIVRFSPNSVTSVVVVHLGLLLTNKISLCLFFLFLKIDMVLAGSFFHAFCLFECCSNYWIHNNIKGNLSVVVKSRERGCLCAFWRTSIEIE